MPFKLPSPLTSTNRSFFLHVLNYAWVLFLIGFSMLIWFHGFGLEKKWLQQAVIALELEQNLPLDQQTQILEWLRAQKEIQVGSIQRIDEKELLELLPNDLGSDSARKVAIEMLPVILLFKMTPEGYKNKAFEGFQHKLNNLNGVHSLNYQNELTTDISKSISRLQRVSMFITLLFVAIGFLISDYLAQVFVDSRSAVIHQWNLLGAPETKILKNYLNRSLSLGLASSLFSVCMLGIVLFMLHYLVPWIYEWIETIKFFWVMFILLILGPSLQYLMVKRKIQTLIR
ncbi:MAG: hypothetical protein IPM92_08220 [Saprospiraceae bacterium]|nr:hypothetical protein [Saprospiraceae bacterium]